MNLAFDILHLGQTYNSIDGPSLREVIVKLNLLTEVGEEVPRGSLDLDITYE